MIETVDNKALHQMAHDTTHWENTLDMVFTITPDLNNMTEMKTGTGMCKHDLVSAKHDQKAILYRKMSRKIYAFKKAPVDKIKIDL